MHLPDLVLLDDKCSIALSHDNCDLHMDPDPRVQVELENLNTSTEFINKLELELEKARSEFNKLLSDSTQKIETLSKKLGSSINKARPYYEARITANELHQKAQIEALRFEQATEAHNKAKEVVHLAEQNLGSSQEADVKLEALLTKSAEKVNQSELDRLQAQRQHEITSRAYSLTEERLTKYHKQLKRSIVKASLETRRNLLDLNNYANQHQLQLLPYFEMKAQFNQMLDEQIGKISSYESRVNKAKSNYTKALQRLEELNSKIYDEASSELNCTEEEYMALSGSNSAQAQRCQVEECPQSQVAEAPSGSSPSPSTTNSSKASIFDNHQVLDELILEDNIESTLEQLKSQCLS